jgi:exonuclease III
MKLITLNIEYGGKYIIEKFGYEYFINQYVVLMQDIDIICMQEIYYDALDMSLKLAMELDMYHMINDEYEIAILSKYPITLLELGSGYMICQIGDLKVCNVHFTDIPCSAYSLMGIHYYNTKNNMDVETAIDSSFECRKDQIESILKHKPNFIVGDFNEMSHLDEFTLLKYSTNPNIDSNTRWINWKTSLLLYDNNFTDISYHFNDISYTCDAQCNLPLDGKLPARIDFIYAMDIIPVDFQNMDYGLSDHSQLYLEFEY